MKSVSSRSHPSQSLLGELRALCNRSLSIDVLVLDARALRLWACASGEGLLVQAQDAPALRDALEELCLSQHELLDALCNEPPPGSSPPERESKSPESRALGPFEVVELIEDDGNSTVFRSRVHSGRPSNELVVVRRIRLSASTQDERVSALLSDTRKAACFAHRHVAQVFNVGVENDAYWIVMENLHGVRLNEVMLEGERDRGASRCVFAAAVGVQAADGLQAIHERCGDTGLVYRYLSPRAVMVTTEGEIKLLPLGTAAYLSAKGGSRSYESPEHERGETLDRRADVYALGALLWELASGTPLHAACERQGAAGRNVDLSSVCAAIDGPLENIIMRALSEHRDARYETALELAQALQTYLSDAGVVNEQAPVQAWFASRGERAPPVWLAVTDAARAGQHTARQRVLKHLSSNASLESVRRGDPVNVTHMSQDMGYIARSFARLYLLVLVFDGSFEPVRARAALKRSLPRVQSMMSAIAAHILS